MKGLQERPDRYRDCRRGGADFDLVILVHGSAGRDGNRAAFWEGGAHSRGGAALHKSPHWKEMFSIRNVRRIMNDQDVIASKAKG
jgi:hypothetical protein